MPREFGARGGVQLHDPVPLQAQLMLPLQQLGSELYHGVDQHIAHVGQMGVGRRLELQICARERCGKCTAVRV